MTKKIIMITLLGSLTFALASDIDAQIEAIKSAPAQKRVELMNQLKSQIAQMNAEDRAEAIAKLQTQLQTGSQTMQQHKEMLQANVQDKATHMQEKTQAQMQQMQQMQQHQVADHMVEQGHLDVHPQLATPGTNVHDIADIHH